MRRVFFALWPDDEARAHLSALGAGLAAGGGRLIRPESLHLTLAFIGAASTAQIARLEDVGSAISAAPFALGLDRLGFWPRGGILWAGCRQVPAPLAGLAGQLAAGLRGAGFALDPHAGAGLVPHVTLVRRARCASLPRLGTPVGWPVGEFALVESQLGSAAATYRTLARFPLADGGSG